MKNHLIASICLLASVLAFGQKMGDIEIIHGPLFKVDKRSVPTGFVGTDETGFYVEYSKGKHGQGDLLLQKFNFDMTPSISQDLSFEVKGGTAHSWTIFKIDDKIYSCATAGLFDYKDFYLQEINPKDLSKSAPVKIASVKPESKSAANVTARFAFSSDSSILSLVYSIPTKRVENEKLGIKVFDRTLKEQWAAEFDLPYTNKLLDPIKYLINDKGEVFMLAQRYFDKRKEKVDDKANYDFLLLQLKEDGSLDSTVIQSEGKFLRGMNLRFAENGDFIAGGFYSEKSNISIGGAYYLRLNGATREVIASSFKEFDTEFFTANLTEKKAARLEKKIEEGKDVDLPSFFIDEFITSPDGSLKMIGEKRMIVTNTVCTQYGCTTYYSYYYDDIAVVQISPEGEIKWATRIAKKQHTTNDNAVLSSYGLLVRSDESVVFFNDNAKNENYDGVGRVTAMVKGSENLLMMVRVDENGNMTRKGLIKQGDADIRFRPKFSQQLNENEILIFGHQGVKTQRFIKIVFEEN